MIPRTQNPKNRKLESYHPSTQLIEYVVVIFVVALTAILTMSSLAVHVFAAFAHISQSLN